MTLIAGGLLLWMVFREGNYLFALIIILVVTLLVLMEQRGPRTVEFQMTDTGFLVNDEFYPYDTMKQFRVIYNPPHTQAIYVTFPSMLRSRLTIPLPDEEDPEKVREAIAEFVEEDLDREGEDVSDTIVRWLKL